MAIGVDTTWLVQVAVREHEGHAAARERLQHIAASGETLALAPQVLNEFVRVITDGSRFQRPLSVIEAIDLVEEWWNAQQVRQVFPTAESTRLAWQWMRQFRLGRKRILDAHLAATFHAAGINRVLTTNARDYRVFECFELL